MYKYLLRLSTRLSKTQLRFPVILKPTFSVRARTPQEEERESWGLLCSALKSALHSEKCGDSSSCQNASVPRPASLLSRPLLGPARERWGASRRLQGKAGGRVARLELPDMGTRLTAGSNWLPSESLPLPPPDDGSMGQHAATYALLQLRWDAGKDESARKKKSPDSQPEFRWHETIVMNDH